VILLFFNKKKLQDGRQTGSGRVDLGPVEAAIAGTIGGRSNPTVEPPTTTSSSSANPINKREKEPKKKPFEQLVELMAQKVAMQRNFYACLSQSFHLACTGQVQPPSGEPVQAVLAIESISSSSSTSSSSTPSSSTPSPLLLQ
jgi:hypothetical protein